MSDVLNLPYVRRHLGLYLDWARNVPQAHPQVRGIQPHAQYDPFPANLGPPPSDGGSHPTSFDPFFQYNG